MDPMHETKWMEYRIVRKAKSLTLNQPSDAGSTRDWDQTN